MVVVFLNCLAQGFLDVRGYGEVEGCGVSDVEVEDFPSFLDKLLRVRNYVPYGVFDVCCSTGDFDVRQSLNPSIEAHLGSSENKCYEEKG